MLMDGAISYIYIFTCKSFVSTYPIIRNKIEYLFVSFFFLHMHHTYFIHLFHAHAPHLYIFYCVYFKSGFHFKMKNNKNSTIFYVSTFHVTVGGYMHLHQPVQYRILSLNEYIVLSSTIVSKKK